GFRVIRDIKDLPRRTRSDPAGTGGDQRLVLLLHMEAFSKVSKRMQRREWDLVIIDESQRLKARASGFSRAARRLRNQARRRLALSGTPIDDSPIDIFGQMRFADHTVLGEDFLTFAEKFCHRGGFK